MLKLCYNNFCSTSTQVMFLLKIFFKKKKEKKNRISSDNKRKQRIKRIRGQRHACLWLLAINKKPEYRIKATKKSKLGTHLPFLLDLMAKTTGNCIYLVKIILNYLATYDFKSTSVMRIHMLCIAQISLSKIMENFLCRIQRFVINANSFKSIPQTIIYGSSES